MSAKNKVTEVQQQADAVLGVMRENITKAIEREGKLADLDEKSKMLEEQSKRMQSGARDLRRQMWCQRLKMGLLISVIVLIILIIILAAAGVFS